MLREIALMTVPKAMLIEGPSDYNAQIEELYLPHSLPIAIYSYAELEDGERRGAFYPFCTHSPEWQALLLARELGIPARFIDLPWAMIAEHDRVAHRYADGELSSSPYIPELCRRAGVEDFDTLWDTLIEIDDQLSAEELRVRIATLCANIRASGPVHPRDTRREAFMVEQIYAALAEFGAPVLVVTGGYHTAGLEEALGNRDMGQQRHAGVMDVEPALQSHSARRGIALTPYTDERLDSLTGYEAGMPNPGFYRQVWEDRIAGQHTSSRVVLEQAVLHLRKRGQVASSADLIAVETSARALAALRGHAHVWRQDLIDAILGTLIKEAIEPGTRHPLLDALLLVLRGNQRGNLAAGSSLPPLVMQINQLLANYGLTPQLRPREQALDLLNTDDLLRSRCLHCLRGLAIPGFRRIDGTDFSSRADLSRLWERWQIRWTPEFEAACIEAAIYGAALDQAASARLTERANQQQRSAEQAALLLLEASLMGLEQHREELLAQLIQLIRSDSDFIGVGTALGHLLYLYTYDEALGTARRADVAMLLRECYDRAIWLLEGLGAIGDSRKLLGAISTVLRCYQLCGAALALDKVSLMEAFVRATAARQQAALLRGAATGALWVLGIEDSQYEQQVYVSMRLCAAPDQLGDFLIGLFVLAREQAQRNPQLLQALDGLLLGYDAEQFLEALPALRIAFSFFTPREKHYLATELLQGQQPASLASLRVDPIVAARALVVEERLLAALERYGIRGTGS